MNLLLTAVLHQSPNLNVLGFADADWGSDENNGTSFTGYVFTINNGAVTWTSHKQSSMALFIMEAEYKSLLDASHWQKAIARLSTFLRQSLHSHQHACFPTRLFSAWTIKPPCRSFSTLYNINARSTLQFDVTLFVKPLKTT
jgi:hypothetical protein